MQPNAAVKPMLVVAAMYTAASGYVHAQQWLTGYRHIPSSVPGSWVVRDGFVVAALSAGLIALVLFAAVRVQRLVAPALVGSAAFHIGSLAALILTRTGSLFGWSEPTWTLGANQARATEIGALVAVGLVAAILIATPRQKPQAFMRWVAADAK